MKYITKRIYNLMGKSDLHSLIKTSDRASVFSEELFETLYKREENKWINTKRKMVKVKFEDIYPETIDFNDIKNAEKLKQKYALEREEAKKKFIPYSFDINKEKQNFKKAYKHRIRELKNKLPDSILEGVADIRVLALNYASKKVKKEIEVYCNKQKKKVEEAFDTYYNYYQTIKDDKILEFDGRLHDSIITNYKVDGKDFIMDIDNSGSFSSVIKIKLKEYKVIEMEHDIKQGLWLYNEIYKQTDGYELHVLLISDKGQLTNLIVSFLDVDILKNN